MKHRSLTEVTQVATVVPLETSPSYELRRAQRSQRLERLADLLEQHTGRVRLLSRIEYLPKRERMLLRDDESPLSLAYRDPVFRGQGLKSDRLGDGMGFFDISSGEAHHVLCDCHYNGAVTPGMVADRVRRLARKTTARDVWNKFASLFTSVSRRG